MNIKEFAEQRNMRANTISAYISRNKDIFESLLDRTAGNDVILSKEAYDLLNKKYPLKKIVENYRDEELEDKYKAVLEENNVLKKKMVSILALKEETDKKLITTEIKLELLEDKQGDSSARIEEQQKQIGELQYTLGQTIEKAKNEEQNRIKAEELLSVKEKELDELRQKYYETSAKLEAQQSEKRYFFG